MHISQKKKVFNTFSARFYSSALISWKIFQFCLKKKTNDLNYCNEVKFQLTTNCSRDVRKSTFHMIRHKHLSNEIWQTDEKTKTKVMALILVLIKMSLVKSHYPFTTPINLIRENTTKPDQMGDSLLRKMTNLFIGFVRCFF